MAQGTKVNVCEFFITKVDISSFVTPKYRTLVPAIGLIYILQLGTLDELVFCQYLVLPSLAFITGPTLLGMLLIRFLQTSFDILSHSTFTWSQSSCTPAGGTLYSLSCHLRCCHGFQLSWGQVTMHTTSRHWCCSVWTILRPSERYV